MTDVLTFPREEIAATLPSLSQWPTCLFGPPGTGKSTMVVEMAAALGLPLYKFAASQSAMWSDLIGGNGADPYGRSPLMWVPRPALIAMGHGMPHPETGERPKPGVLLIDDIHLAGPDLQAALYTVLDAGLGGCVTLDTGADPLYPLDGYRVVCTMNGDPAMLDEPILSRLGGNVIPVLEPSEAAYQSLDPRIAALCRADYGRATPVLSFRHWAGLNRNWPLVGIERAALMACEGNVKRASTLLQVLANPDLGIADAASAYARLLAATPSGVR